jgi:glycerol-3-phosphate dehydrogenase (NAD(P)+)
MEAEAKPNELTVTVLGAGSWGLTLGLLSAGQGYATRVWSPWREEAQRVVENRGDPVRLPGIELPASISVGWKLPAALEGADLLVLAVPSQAVRSVSRSVAAELLGTPPTIVCASKGLERPSLRRLTEVMGEELTRVEGVELGVLVGPSHAEEVSRGMPTTVVASSRNPEVSQRIQDAFNSPTFRVYTNDDLVGVELAVALKNVIAIAAGMCDGLGFGDNTKGALLTRGLAEITRLGVAMGARPSTFAGLAGVGDLVTTCASRHSRNRFVGEQIGRGKRLDEVLREMTMVAEGVETTAAVKELSRMHGVEMPIADEVYSILFEGKDPSEAWRDLMNRSPKSEELQWP